MQHVSGGLLPKTSAVRPEVMGPPVTSVNDRSDQRRSVPLSDYFERNVQPSVATVIDRMSSNVGPGNKPAADDENPLRRRKLYVHWRPTSMTVIVAENMRLDGGADSDSSGSRQSGNRLVSTGRLYSVPLEHRGWYELLSADGHSAAPVTTIGRLLELGVDRFLVRQPMSVSVVSDAGSAVTGYDDDPTGRHVLRIAVGETLSIVGCENYRPSRRSSSTAQRQSPSDRVRCRIDRNGKEIELFADQRGLFAPVAGPTTVSGVHRVRTLVGKFRLPIVVRLVCCSNGDRSSNGGNEVTAGTILRLISVDVEPAVHVIPMSSSSPTPTASFDAIFIVPKRASIFVDSVPMNKETLERQKGRQTRPDVSDSSLEFVNELCRRCEEVIGSSDTVSVICGLLPVPAPTATNKRNVDSDQSVHWTGNKSNCSNDAQMQNMNLGRQPSVDSGTSSLTGGGTQPPTAVETPSSLSDTAESRLMDEIDIIYDAIRGQSPSHHKQQTPHRSASYCVRSRPPLAEYSKNVVERRPEVGGSSAAHQRQSAAAAATRRQQNVPQRSMTLDTNFVIATPRRYPVRSSSQPPRPDRQLTRTALGTAAPLRQNENAVAGLRNGECADVGHATTNQPKLTIFRGQAAAPMKENNLVSDNNNDDECRSSYENRIFIGFESSEFEDDVVPTARHQNDNRSQQVTEDIYDSLMTAADVSLASVGDKQFRQFVDPNKTVDSHHQPARRSARPQSFAGTANASLTDFRSKSNEPSSEQFQRQPLKRYPSDSRQSAPLPPPPPSSRSHQPVIRTHSAFLRPPSGHDRHVTSGHHTAPPQTLKSPSSSSLGGALGVLSRSFFSTVRRVGGSRSANSKTLVLNRTNSANEGGNYCGSGNSPFNSCERQHDVACNGHKSKMWWNADGVRSPNDHQRDLAGDPTACNAFTMPQTGFHKRFSYADPRGRDYNARRLFVKRI